MALKDFLTYGVQYVFPAEIGNIVRGVPTYISASPIKEQLAESRDYYVWRSAKGTARGQQITPLYLSVPNAVLKDDELYQLLVIVDTLRVGGARERGSCRLCQIPGPGPGFAGRQGGHAQEDPVRD